LIGLLAASVGHWTIWSVLLHPLRPGNPVDAWGGILSCLGYLAILGTLLGSIAVTYRKHECHIEKCHWLAWHPDETGHPVCRGHHPQGRGHPLLAPRPRWAQTGGAPTAGAATTELTPAPAKPRH
jgi:hypothetical protein